MMDVIMMLLKTTNMIGQSVDQDDTSEDDSHDIEVDHDKRGIDCTDRIMIMANVIVIIKSYQRDFATRTLTRL